MLADKLAARTDEGLEKIVDKTLEAMSFAPAPHAKATRPNRLSAAKQATDRSYRLPRQKPRIVAVRYGQDKSEGRYGLMIVNEGESAYDISISSDGLPIGSGRLLFCSGISRLTTTQKRVVWGTLKQEQDRRQRNGNDPHQPLTHPLR